MARPRETCRCLPGQRGDHGESSLLVECCGREGSNDGEGRNEGAHERSDVNQRDDEDRRTKNERGSRRNDGRKILSRMERIHW